MVVATALAVSAVAAGVSAGFQIDAGRKAERSAKRQADAVIENARNEVNLNNRRTSDLAQQQLAQFAAAGVDPEFGSQFDVLRENFSRTVEENSRVSRAATQLARSIRRGGRAAKQGALIQAGTTLVTSGLALTGTAVQTGAFGLGAGQPVTQRGGSP